MGGRSKSSQKTSTSNEAFNLAANGDGDVIHGDGNLRADIGDNFTGGDRTETEIDIRTDVEQGDWANNSGTVNITDGGAFNLVEEVTTGALGATAEAIDQAVALSGDTVDAALGFGADALDSMSGATESALDFGDRALDLSAKNTDVALTKIAGTAGEAIDANNEVVTKGLATIKDLAAETALGGQTVVAETAGKMVLYLSVAIVALLGGAMFVRAK
ncbi:hypothetical protein [Ferrimonas balearica]|uniref:hypothetical protein n=1 Tax=Ferrimonas balearica TaxID=44012 RepID=UPI001F48879A|nr:hypothetical protein [Ferrimonas balearica]MBY6095126.1 hypothetical protein [Ferrimonas balearica]